MIETYYGPRDYGPRKATYGIIFHTTESAGTNLLSAKATARWQQRSSTGSYHFIVATDGTINTVRIENSAGGVNPWSPAWNPEGRAADPRFNDPNAQFVQVAFEGKVAVLDPKWPESMIQQAVDIVDLVEKKFGIDAILLRHRDFQDNRSDPGVNLVPKVLEAWRKRHAPVPAPVPEAPKLYGSSDVNLAGKRSEFGTLFPTYVRSYEEGFNWYARQVRYLKEKGII